MKTSGKTSGKRRRPTTRAARAAERKTPPPVACNEKELAFIDHWMIHFNGSRAIRDAGIHRNPLVAKTYASAYLDRPHVIMEILARRKRISDRLEQVKERMMDELRVVGLASLKGLVRWKKGKTVKRKKKGKVFLDYAPGGFELVDSAELDDEQLAAIQEIEEVPGEWGTKRKVKLHDKLGAIAAFNKAMGPSDEELRARGGGTAGSATIIIEGGPTGLEIHVAQASGGTK